MTRPRNLPLPGELQAKVAIAVREHGIVHLARFAEIDPTTARRAVDGKGIPPTIHGRLDRACNNLFKQISLPLFAAGAR